MKTYKVLKHPTRYAVADLEKQMNDLARDGYEFEKVIAVPTADTCIVVIMSKEVL